MTAPVRRTATNPSRSGASAATTVPNAASRITSVSGNPSPSPTASWCLETSWKFDQIAGVPITRVLAPPSSETIARLSVVAKSIASWSFPRKRIGSSAARPSSKTAGLGAGRMLGYRPSVRSARTSAARVRTLLGDSTKTAMRTPRKVGKRSRRSPARTDWLPGTSQPPPDRWSVWWSENHAPARRSASQSESTSHRRRAAVSASRPRIPSTAEEVTRRSAAVV